MDHAEDDILISVEGRAALAKLNRPKALNSVTPAIISALEALFHRCAKNPHIYGVLLEAEGKAFSAGGDIRTLRSWIATDVPRADRFYAEEYQHNWSLECFRKPQIALMNGVTMGGGVGISIFGTHRIARRSNELCHA